MTLSRRQFVMRALGTAAVAIIADRAGAQDQQPPGASSNLGAMDQGAARSVRREIASIGGQIDLRAAARR